jgi:glycosyltransferase involved in cell wall biosynthesis
MKKLSIIIPHYNNWDMLMDLIKSIPPSEEIEVIVVDDKSSIEDKQALHTILSFPHVKLYSNDTNVKGAGKARNIGLSRATGEWILFADSDDKFSIDFLENIKPLFTSKSDVIFFNPGSFSEFNTDVSDRHIRYSQYINDYLSKNEKDMELALRYKFIVPWSKMIRHSLIKEHNIKFEEIMVSNDILFSAKIGYYAKEIEAKNIKIYSVRLREGSLTSQVNSNTLKVRFNAWLDYHNFLKINLNDSDFNSLSLNSFSFLKKIIKVDNKTKCFMYIVKKSFLNKVPVIDRRLFNLKKVLRKITL